MRYLEHSTRLLFAGILAAGMPLCAVAFGGVASADPCTDVPYEGCVVIPNAPVPESPPGVSSDLGVPGWTPGVNLCTPLGGHEVTVGKVCI